MKEMNVLRQIRVECSKRGYLVFRNNVGVAFRDDGIPIRFGLANESKNMNQNYASADLIGIAPKIITPEDIGKTMGLFLSLEIKHSDIKYAPQNQRNWERLVTQYGGIAKIINHVDQIP